MVPKLKTARSVACVLRKQFGMAFRELTVNGIHNQCSSKCNPVQCWKWDLSPIIYHNKPVNYAVLVLNTPITQSQRFFTDLWNNAKLRTTVDGGTKKWETFINTCSQEAQTNIKLPDLVTGDFDSISQDDLEKYRKKGCKVIQTPDQNYTDFTKALIELTTHCQQTNTDVLPCYVFRRVIVSQQLHIFFKGHGSALRNHFSKFDPKGLKRRMKFYAYEVTESSSKIYRETKIPEFYNVFHDTKHGPIIDVDHVIAIAQSSRRMDQIFGNVETMFLAKEMKLLNPTSRLYLISDDAISWLLFPGDHVIAIPEESRTHPRAWCSLVPVGEPCISVSSSGLKWDLNNHTLKFGKLVSTSNTFTESDTVTVKCSHTLLWSMKVPSLQSL